MENNNQLFRKKTMDRISSPEQLNDYVKVANPGIWMVMGAIICLLLGTIVWGIFGRLSTHVKTPVISDGHAAICYLTEDQLATVQKDMTVTAGDESFTITEIAKTPVQLEEGTDPYVFYVGDLTAGTWVYEASLLGDLAEGVYPGDIVTERVSPLSFLLN